MRLDAAQKDLEVDPSLDFDNLKVVDIGSYCTASLISHILYYYCTVDQYVRMMQTSCE